MSSAPSEAAARFRVPWGARVFGALLERTRPLWLRLGGLESAVLSDDLEEVRLDRPVYVTGMARSGTTILLELLSRHPEVATHRYRDFPPIYTPYWWSWFLDRLPRRDAPAVERAHGDGIAVTAESPEAMEEALWMAYFPAAHDPTSPHVLGEDTAQEAFEGFYRDHVRKLLMARGRGRYVAKANYHLTRLGYLPRLAPGCRVLLLYRDPLATVASAMRQHARFAAGAVAHPESVDHLRRVGHFEFGADRRPIHTGDTARLATVQELWAAGDELRGWARYWSYLYDHVAAVLEAGGVAASVTRLVSFEALCAAPGDELAALLAFAKLEAGPELLEHLAARVRAPRPPEGFSDADRVVVTEETAATWSRLEALRVAALEPAGEGGLHSAGGGEHTP